MVREYENRIDLADLLKKKKKEWSRQLEDDYSQYVINFRRLASVVQY